MPRRVGIKERVADVLGVEPQEIWPPEPPAQGGSWAPPTASYPGTFEGVDRRSLVRALGGSFAGAVVAPSAAFATSN